MTVHVLPLIYGAISVLILCIAAKFLLLAIFTYIKDDYLAPAVAALTLAAVFGTAGIASMAYTFGGWDGSIKVVWS